MALMLSWSAPQLSPTQRTALAELHQLAVMRVLLPFRPLLAGTFPLDLASRHSDLDILCCVPNESVFPALEGLLQQHFGKMLGFDCQRMTLQGEPSLVCRFTATPFPVEIVAQAIPTVRQRAWKHLLAEAQLLLEAPAAAIQMLRRLKVEGWATEPAFTETFHIPGDPYLELERLAPSIPVVREDEAAYHRTDSRRRSA